MNFKKYICLFSIVLIVIMTNNSFAVSNDVLLSVNGRAWTSIDYNLFLNEKVKDIIQPIDIKMNPSDLFVMSRLLIEEAAELGLLSKSGGLSDLNNAALEKERLSVASELYSLKKKQIKTIQDEKKWIESIKQKYLFKFISDEFRKL